VQNSLNTARYTFNPNQLAFFGILVQDHVISQVFVQHGCCY
jgi:hypothetical protein